MLLFYWLRRLYVTRIVGGGASPSSVILKDGIVTRLALDTSPDISQRTSAKLVSLRGVSNGTTITFTEVVGVTTYEESRPVKDYDSGTNTITWDETSPLEYKYTKAGTRVTIEAPAQDAITVEVQNPGKWGDDLQVRVSHVAKASSMLTVIDVQTTLVQSESKSLAVVPFSL